MSSYTIVTYRSGMTPRLECRYRFRVDGVYPNTLKLSLVCPEMPPWIVKNGELSLMFFEIIDFILFKAKLANYWA